MRSAAPGQGKSKAIDTLIPFRVIDDDGRVGRKFVALLQPGFFGLLLKKNSL